jgi:hypothetical protein
MTRWIDADALHSWMYNLALIGADGFETRAAIASKIYELKTQGAGQPDWTPEEWAFARDVVRGHREGIQQIENGQTASVWDLPGYRQYRTEEARRVMNYTADRLRELWPNFTFDLDKEALAYVDGLADLA